MKKICSKCQPYPSEQKKQCRNRGGTCENACAWQTKGCAKGTETSGLLTNDPALSSLLPFSMFYTARNAVRIRDCESNWESTMVLEDVL